MTTLEAAIAAEKAAIGEFIPLLKSEEQALIDGNTETLAKIVAENADRIFKISTISREREKLLQAQGFSADRAGIESWLAKNPSSRKPWEELLELSREASNLNKTIGALIDLRLRQNQQALSVLEMAANKNASLYGPDGFSHAGHSGHGHISA